MALSAHRWRISLQAWLSLLALGLALMLLAHFAALLLEVFWVLFGAFLVNLALRPLAARLSSVHLPRWLTILLVYLALIGLLVLIGSLLFPIIQKELGQLQDNGPALLEAAFARLAEIPGLARQLPSLDELAKTLGERLDTVILTALGTLSNLGEFAVQFIIVLVLAFFFANDKKLGQRLLNHWVPLRRRAYVRQVLFGISHLLTRWAWAQLATALLFAVPFGIALKLLNVPFALTIALVGGVLEIIPFVGSVTALILSILSALTVGPWLVLWVVIVHQVIAQIEANVVLPYFFGRAIGLHAAVVLIALLVGAKAAGVIGALFAVPMAVILVTLLDELRTLFITPETPSALREALPDVRGPAQKELPVEHAPVPHEP